MQRKNKLWKQLCIVVALTAAAQADGLVTEVKMRQERSAVHIMVRANAAVQYRSRSLDKSVVVDLFPATLGSTIKADYAVNSALVTKVHIKQLDDSTVRVTVDATAPPSYALTERPGSRGLALDVSPFHPGRVRKNRAKRKLVTLDLVDADLVGVIKLLAKTWGRNLYLGPGVRGSVTAKLNDVPAEGALKMFLDLQESKFAYKVLAPDTIVVAESKSLQNILDYCGPSYYRDIPKNSVRREFLLKTAPAPKVLSILDSRFKHVRFMEHPTSKGFFATGSIHDLNKVRELIPELDKAPAPEPPLGPVREIVKIRYGNLAEIKQLMAGSTRRLRCQISEDNSGFILEGSLYDIREFKEKLAQLFENSLTETWFSAPHSDPSRSSTP